MPVMHSIKKNPLQFSEDHECRCGFRRKRFQHRNLFKGGHSIGLTLPQYTATVSGVIGCSQVIPYVPSRASREATDEASVIFHMPRVSCRSVSKCFCTRHSTVRSQCLWRQGCGSCAGFGKSWDNARAHGGSLGAREGELNSIGARHPCKAAASFGVGTHEGEFSLKCCECSIGVLRSHHNAQLDFAGADHFHIDGMLSERMEDAATHIGVAAKTDAGDSEFSDESIGGDDRLRMPVKDFAEQQERAIEI